MNSYTPKSEFKKHLNTDNTRSVQTAQLKDNRTIQLKQTNTQQLIDNSSRVIQQKEKAATITEAPIQRVENKTGLPDQLKLGIESLSGMDMSDTRVHYNSTTPAQLQAHAFAQGNNIHIAPGQEQHLPHEAWHVVQQKQGRVKATKQLKGKTLVNDDAGLEREADIMGAKAMQLKQNATQSLKKDSGNLSSTVQRVTNKSTGQTVPIDFDSLSRAEALRILQKVASHAYTATKAEMIVLHDIVNPNRDKFQQSAVNQNPKKKSKGITRLGTLTKNDFGSRQDLFAENARKGYTQHVLPSHSDFDEITAKQKEVNKGSGTSLTEDQAWALVMADKKSKHHLKEDRARALKRLQRINPEYGESDLHAIIQHMHTGMHIATNYTFSKKPGANIDKGVSTETRTLASLLMDSATFKNVWMTGASQASTDLPRRGGVEESMGYGKVLHRTKGSSLEQDEQGHFDPISAEDLPKYGGLVSERQIHGVAPRYGPSVVYWKHRIKNRITYTPTDSWNKLGMGAFDRFTSARRPEAILAYCDESLLRLMAAEATGKDPKFLAKMKRTGMTTEAYVETQIHGNLTWLDVAHIVIGQEEENYQGLVAAFRAHAKKHGLSYRVSVKKPRPGSEKYTGKKGGPNLGKRAKSASHLDIPQKEDGMITRAATQNIRPIRPAAPQETLAIGDRARVAYHAHYDVVGIITNIRNDDASGRDLITIRVTDCYVPKTTEDFRSDHTRGVLNREITWYRSSIMLES